VASAAGRWISQLKKTLRRSWREDKKKRAGWRGIVLHRGFLLGLLALVIGSFVENPWLFTWRVAAITGNFQRRL
jgi:uncharacterized BrkB/YihY/UPF0761 family membrane protein